MGVPRRVMDVSYGGEAPAFWSTLMALVGAGGVIMALALLAYAATLLASVVGRRGAHDSQGFVGLQWVTLPSGNTAAWTGPLSILVIAAAMYGFGAIGFELLQAVPVIATGTAGH